MSTSDTLRPGFRYALRQSHRYRDGILTVILRKPDDQDLRLEMDGDLQISTHYHLKVVRPPATVETVFSVLKAKFETDNPDLNLQPRDLDVMAIANYIEHRLRLGEADNQFEYGVQWRVDATYGVCIIIQQNSGPACVNTNEQRYIHQSNLSDQEMCDSLAYMHIGHFRLSKIEVDTVRRLREIIRKNIQRHPRDQIDHWLKVSTAYLKGEIVTIEHAPIYTPSGNITGFCL